MRSANVAPLARYLASAACDIGSQTPMGGTIKGQFIAKPDPVRSGNPSSHSQYDVLAQPPMVFRPQDKA
jgi:hypothetical protein